MIAPTEGLAERPETPRPLRGNHWIDREHEQAVFVDKLGDSLALSWGIECSVLINSDCALLDARNLRALADLLDEIATGYGL